MLRVVLTSQTLEVIAVTVSVTLTVGIVLLLIALRIKWLTIHRIKTGELNTER